jgi:hypothetical protein
VEDTIRGPMGSARAVTALFWTVCFGILATLLYFYGLHSTWGNADLVRGLLQGTDMAKGNVLLNHWYSGSDNFLTIDLVFFAFAVLIFGQKVVLLHFVSCLVWAALIFAAGHIAAFRLTRWARLCAMLTVIALLALPCPLLAQALSQSLVHIGTSLYVLVAFIALRKGRFGRSWLIATVVLAASTFGDPLTIAYALGPAFAVGILESIRERDWRRGMATWSAPIIAVVLAGLFRLATNLLGTFRISSSAPLVSHSQILQNLRSLFPGMISLLGLGPSLRTSGVPWELEIFRSFGVLILTIGVFVAIRSLLSGFLSRQRRIDVQATAEGSDFRFRLSDLLFLAVVGDGATYVLLGRPESGLHYLTPGIIFASILGAMSLGQFVERGSSLRTLRVVTVATVLIVGCSASSVAVILTDSVSPSPYSGVASFLVGHHLYKGVGDYWTSAPVTVYSDGKVAVRQVTTSTAGGLEPYLVLSKSTWYTGKFQFLIYSLNESAYGASQHYGQAISENSHFPFSQVAQTYSYLDFRIVVWERPVTIAELEDPQSADLAGIEGETLRGPSTSHWPALSAVPADQIPLFASSGETVSSESPLGSYKVDIYDFYSPSAETDFYENRDLALSYEIPSGAALTQLVGSTGVNGTSEGFNLLECRGSSSVEAGNKCSGNAGKPNSAGVITVFKRASTVTVITYRPSVEHNAALLTGELSENVKVANSVISLLASAGHD